MMRTTPPTSGGAQAEPGGGSEELAAAPLPLQSHLRWNTRQSETRHIVLGESAAHPL